MCGALTTRGIWCAAPAGLLYLPASGGRSHKVPHIQSEHQLCDVSDSLDRVLFTKAPKSMSGNKRRNILDSQENTCFF